METVEEFLLFLAKKANPRRFFPFPERFRVDDSKRDEALPDCLQPYTVKDSVALQAALADPDDELKAHIMNIPVEMAFHGNDMHPKITEYQFKYNIVKERLRDNVTKERWYLYHGSNLGNWHSILRNGIRNMSRTSLMTAGAAYGSGIYLSDSLQFAMSYGGVGQTKCVAVVEIFVDPAQYMKGPNVFVIPDDSLLIPRYLYRVKGSIGNIETTSVLGYYKKQKDTGKN